MSVPFVDPGLLLAFSFFLVLGVVALASDRYGCDSRFLGTPDHHS